MTVSAKNQDDFCIKQFHHCKYTNRNYMIKGCTNYKTGNTRKKKSVRDCPQCGKETKIEWIEWI